MRTPAEQKFVDDLSHDLRTSLSVIKTTSEVALLDPLLDARFKKLLQSHIEEIDRLTDILATHTTHTS